MARLDLGKVVGENGQDALINGVNTLTIVEGNNIDIQQVEDTMTINFDNNGTYATATQLSTETTNRENADTNLQGQIDAITVSSDVIDVVGTYTDLQNYDTTHVKANDIIKVLQDSTHSNALAYYRWVITNDVGSWVYVGSEGPFYTKSEADTLLNGYATKNDIKVEFNDGEQSYTWTTSQDTFNYIATNFGGALNQIFSDLDNKQNKSLMIQSINEYSSSSSYPSGSAVYDYGNVVVDLTGTTTGTLITDTTIVNKLLDDRCIIKYGNSNYRFARLQDGVIRLYTVMDDFTSGKYIALVNQNGSLLFYETGSTNWEVPSNKVTSLSSSSTDTEYPSAKCVYDAIQGAGGGDNSFVNVAPHFFSTLTTTDIQSIIDNMLDNNIDIAYLRTPRSGYRNGAIVVASLSSKLSSTTTSYVLNVWDFDFKDNPTTNGISHNKQAYNVTISWSGNVPTVTNTSKSGSMSTNTIYLNGSTQSWTPSTDYSPVHKKYVDDKPTTYTGYDATKTQVLKNVNGTLTWVDES